MDIFQDNYKSSFNSDELERYQRHFSLETIGLEGQRKLKSSSVLIIGAGGLGSPAILYIAAAGVGKIGIIDNDKVEKSNLQRQIIHDTSELDKYKTESAKKKIQNLNPNCKVKTYTQKICIENAIEIIQDFDIVCDCSDNFPTRYLVNDSCFLLKKPMIYGSVQGFEGQVSVFNLHHESPNLRDLLPESPQGNNIPSCEEFGVMGISTGLIGILQANEVIKIITNKGTILDGQVLIFNLLSLDLKKFNLKANNKYKQIKNLEEFKEFYESQTCDKKSQNIDTVAAEEFKKLYKKNPKQILIIDVREDKEFENYSIRGSVSIPLNILQKESSIDFIKNISNGKTIFTLCKKGISSRNASKVLLGEKIKSFSIEGGIENLSNDQFFNIQNY